jgi:prephenate dehydrogenase
LEYISEKEIICYGAGRMGSWLGKFLIHKNYKLKIYFDKYSLEKKINGIAVLRPTFIKTDVILLAVGKEIQKEVIEELSQYGYKDFYSIELEHEIVEIFDFFGVYPYNFNSKTFFR